MNMNYILPSLLYTLLSSSWLASSQTRQTANGTPVLDAGGHELQAGAKYYLVPAVRGQNGGVGGGIALASRDGTCPFYVMQESLPDSNGHPLRFLAADGNQKVISLSTDANVVFSAATICVQSTAWKVGGADWKTGRRYVRSGAVIGKAGAATVSNWFKIEKHGNGSNGYKIVFCPSVCSSCKVVCGDVGVFYEDGKRWVGLSDEPLIVMFKAV